jgi:hypothetical protein
VRKTAQLLRLQLQVLEMRDYPYDFAMLLDQVRAERSEAILVLMSPRASPEPRHVPHLGVSTTPAIEAA